MSGSTIGGAIGYVIGFYIGGPAGGQIGWMIGSAVGGYVDPTQITGPRLQDMRGQTSSVGGPIPRAWGTAPVPCNIIWQQPGVTEHKHTDDGKGSGTETVTFTYTRSYAVMFHIGEIAGVLQIRRNKKIVLDRRDDATMFAEYTAAGLSNAAANKRIQAQRAENAKWLAKATIYNGTETQTPDPTIESYNGVGNVPAYRGRAYMVVTDDETQAGEIAQFEVVIAVCGDITNVPGGATWVIGYDGSPSVEFSTDGLEWSGSGITPSPVWSPNSIAYSATEATSVLLITPAPTFGTEPFVFSDDMGATWSACTGLSIESSGGACIYSGGYWHVADIGNKTQRSNNGIAFSAVATAPEVYDFAVFGNSLYAFGTFKSIHKANLSGDVWSADSNISGSTSLASMRMRASLLNLGVVGIEQGSFGGGGDDDFRCHIYSKSGSVWTEHTNPFSDVLDTFVSRPSLHYSDTLGIWVVIFHNRVAYGPSLSSLTLSSHVFADAPLNMDGDISKIIACGGSGLLEWTDDGDIWHALAPGPTVSIFTVSSFWNPGSQAAIPDAPGWYTNPDGYVSGPGYDYITPCSTTTISEIVGEICDLSGLEDNEYDVSALTDTLPGYVVARETDGLSVIESLRPIGMFDPAEWDKKQRFIKRSGVSSFAINGDDLVERDGDAFERQLVQEVELLRRVSVGYIDPDANWAPNTQKWERRVGTINARGEATIEISASLGADLAATTAKRRGLTAWGEPEKQKFSLPYRLASVTPTDIGAFTDDDGEVNTVRIMQVDDDSGVRLIESANNCAEAYSATATGATPKPPTITDESLRGPTVLYAMNLDSLRHQDNVPGMYIAACGILAGWPGCSVELSTDGGATFRPITNINTPATMGYLTSNLDVDSNGGEPIQVFLYAGGQLSSVSAQQVADGANASAIMTNDIGEVIQFQTATATASGYDLTDLVRGVNDTDAVPHAYGDPFVLLDSAVIFVPIDSIFAGLTLIFRGVAFGTSSDAATEFSVVYEPPTFVLDGGGA